MSSLNWYLFKVYPITSQLICLLHESVLEMTKNHHQQQKTNQQTTTNNKKGKEIR